jgi:hypothetical protein
MAALDLGAESVLGLLTGEDEQSTRLRQSNPFAGVLTDRERNQRLRGLGWRGAENPARRAGAKRGKFIFRSLSKFCAASVGRCLKLSSCRKSSTASALTDCG